LFCCQDHDQLDGAEVFYFSTIEPKRCDEYAWSPEAKVLAAAHIHSIETGPDQCIL
jgi:hypothetical protein